MDEKKDYIPGQYHVTGICLIYENESTADIDAEGVTGQMAEDIRNGRVREIHIRLE